MATGLSLVYQCFIIGTKSALRSWMPTSRSTPFCPCKSFSSQGYPKFSLTEPFGAEDPLGVKNSLAEPFKSSENSWRLFALCTSTSAGLDHVTIVYQQDERRSSFLDADWMQTSTPSRLHAWYASAHSCASTNQGILI